MGEKDAADSLIPGTRAFKGLPNSRHFLVAGGLAARAIPPVLVENGVGDSLLFEDRCHHP